MFVRAKDEDHGETGHIPGYMGFVRRAQFEHGDSYGKITRTVISDYNLNGSKRT